MPGGTPHHLDTVDAIDESEDVREIVLRMTRLAQGGRLEAFVALAAADERLDDATRECVLELADESLLATVEPHLARRYNRARRAISSVG